MTRGTALNPVRILEQTDFSHSPDVSTIRPMERRGSYFAFYRAAAGREKHALTWSGNLTYNQFVWVANLYLKANLTGTGAGADKTYPFVPASAADDVKTATLEWGYDTALSASQPGFRLPYVVGDELTVTFDKTSADGVTFAAAMHSPKAISQITAFGGTPTALTSTAMVPTQTQVYIDPTTIGTTVDNYVVKAEFKLNHQWTDLDTLNATTAAQDTFRVGARAWTLTVDRYYINKNELDRYNDKATRKIRILSTGPTLGASNYKATLDLYGAATGYSYAATDGLIHEQITYEPVYDTTAVTDHSLTVISAEATVS